MHLPLLDERGKARGFFYFRRLFDGAKGLLEKNFLERLPQENGFRPSLF